ncbi:class I SAM-dependent methyltransferase [Candidatus Methylacidiphilum infernorum]|uniref:class I SAM-dependent methyltransferase n=1 Tax=Candidatus Methylacidiphilum infernorum TaxID=511746 RepID=UPI001F5DCA4D|nr:methyltransferase domain-containing protein [Candidatus Methylacidiphilum infernorum]
MIMTKPSFILFCGCLCLFTFRETIQSFASSPSVKTSRDTPALARSYQRLSLAQYQQGKKLVGLLNIKPKDKVLDIGCGSGELAAYVAQFCSPQGFVLGIDPSPYRIELAQKKRAKNCYFRVASSDQLYFLPSNSFDVVYLNYVLHWIENKRQVFEEIFRLLKPGGRLGISMGDKQQNSKVYSILMKSIHETLGKIPSERLVTPYYISREQLEKTAIQSGFSIDHLYVEENIHYLSSPSKVIEFFEASDFGNFLAGIPQKTKRKIIRKMRENLARLATPRGIEMKYRTIVFIGHKP